MFLLSIIIPHYNDPHSLERLLQSIPQCDEIQVIVVDDKSTVNTDGIEQQIISRAGGYFCIIQHPVKVQEPAEISAYRRPLANGWFLQMQTTIL